MQWNAHGTVERDRVTFDEGVRTSLREGTMGNGWFRVIQQTLLYVSIFDIYIYQGIYIGLKYVRGIVRRLSEGKIKNAEVEDDEPLCGFIVDELNCAS